MGKPLEVDEAPVSLGERTAGEEEVSPVADRRRHEVLQDHQRRFAESRRLLRFEPTGRIAADEVNRFELARGPVGRQIAERRRGAAEVV